MTITVVSAVTTAMPNTDKVFVLFKKSNGGGRQLPIKPINNEAN